MATNKRKKALHPSLGRSLRRPADTPRDRFLYTDVTKAELGRIQRYCKEKEISVSQFLADLMLEDALKTDPDPQPNVRVQLEFDMTADELEKLQLLARLYEKGSIEDFVRQILQPYLEVRRLHTPLETTTLRYYLSEDEHKTIRRHLDKKGISARNYAAVLALKAVETS